MKTKEEKDLILKDLRISLETWGDNEGKYTAKIAYQGEEGKIELVLSPELSNELLRFSGLAIKKFSAAALSELNESFERSFKKAKLEEKKVLGND